MKLSEAIEGLPEQIRRDYPGGVNFKNKSKFVGVHHHKLGGSPEVYLSLEMIESDQWVVSFRILDKAFAAMLTGTFEAMGGKPSDQQVRQLGYKHPCREKCEGWQQGFEAGRFESREEIARLKGICRDLARASKNKRTAQIAFWFGKYFKEESQ